MVSSLSLSLATTLFQSSSSGGIDVTQLYASGSSSGSSLPPGVALKQAQANEAKQLDQVRKDPQVKKDIARYAKVVSTAKTLNDVLDDPVARKVFMKANGLGDQTDYVGLAKKALASDPSDAKSLANQLSSVNGNWLDTVKRFDFKSLGVTALRLTGAVAQVTDDYVSETRLDNLDQATPGLGSAILFKTIAPTLTTPLKVLGSALGREVIVTALGLPKAIAVQSLEAQSKAVTQRLDLTKLKDPEFVDQLVQRYLLQLNGGAGGVTA